MGAIRFVLLFGTFVLNVSAQARFAVTRQQGNWASQREQCQSMNGVLASIRNQAEYNTVLDLISGTNQDYYIGATRTGTPWRWIDDGTWWQSNFNDGLSSGEPTIVIWTTDNNRWHDDNMGRTDRLGLCRLWPQPTVAPTMHPSVSPTSSSPTSVPSQSPTRWFEHAQFYDNFADLQAQVNRLAASEAHNRIQLETMQSQINNLQTDHTTLNSGVTILQDQLSQTRAAISRAVESFSTVSGRYADAGGEVDSCVDCKPSIEGVGHNLELRAHGGAVRLQTLQCGEVDPCQAHIGLNAVNSAMEELRNA